MSRRHQALTAAVLAAWCTHATHAAAPARPSSLSGPAPTSPPVTVTLALDAAQVTPGTTTRLRAFARIAPAFLPLAEQIFSWHLDLLAPDPEIATLQPSTLLRPRSDEDPVLGSPGITDGPHLLGIRDSFIELPAAGHSGPVELFSIAIQTLNPGTAVFRLRPGSIGSSAGVDFLVLPIGPEDPWSGADYSAASVSLTVSDGTLLPPGLRIRPLPTGGARIEVEVAAGSRAQLEDSDSPTPEARWTTIAESAPGETSLVWTTPATAPSRFYRARSIAAGR
jgi:hypothetical protein